MVLGLDRLATASFLRPNGTFQYLTGLPSFPDPQTLRRFLLQAQPRFWEQIHLVNDLLLQHFIHWPEHRSRLIFDLDSTIVTVFGHQDGAEVGYNPRYRGICADETLGASWLMRNRREWLPFKSVLTIQQWLLPWRQGKWLDTTRRPGDKIAERKNQSHFDKRREVIRVFGPAFE